MTENSGALRSNKAGHRVLSSGCTPLKIKKLQMCRRGSITTAKANTLNCLDADPTKPLLRTQRLPATCRHAGSAPMASWLLLTPMARRRHFAKGKREHGVQKALHRSQHVPVNYGPNLVHFATLGTTGWHLNTTRRMLVTMSWMTSSLFL